MKKLSICIPTYRRPALLERCILSAIESAGDRPVDIVVADDAISDANVQVMQRLVDTYPFVHWHRNDLNLGIDDNIQHAVNLCITDYAWLVGEDDVFLPDAVASMHDLLQTLDAPFVFANYYYVDGSMRCVMGAALDPLLDPAVPCSEFIAKHLWAVGFIGACVLNKACWSLTSAAPYKGTYYTHVGRIVEMLAHAEAVYLMRMVCVANRVEGKNAFTWNKDSYGVYFGFVRMCEQVAERVPKMADEMREAHIGFERRYRWLSLRLAVRLRSELAFDLAQYRKYLADYPMSGVKRLAFLLISISPPSVFWPLVLAYRTLRRQIY
ncbi:MAG: glycosyltransferase family 2 protein [Steroidobacteraceae bacterium]